MDKTSNNEEKIIKTEIQQLPTAVANRIAAGEVIERPASLIKELIENSIDAGATDIKIEVENGGIDSITIIDNGGGIVGEQLPLAITHHATSKISSIDDLDNIYTLGFRGEALASIADVSRLEIRSKSREESSGANIVIEGGETKSHAPYPIAEGTTIIVKNLFYNMPARYKFLKTPSGEFMAIKNVFDSFVVSKYNVALSLQHNNGNVYRYNASASIKERLKDYLDESIYSELLEVQTEYDDIKIFGYVSNMNVMQNYRKNAAIFLNGRVIDNKTLAFAIKNAYKGVIPSDKHPYYYIYISLDASKVDVNVHPSKKEVRIKSERDIASLLYKEILNQLAGSSLLGHSINKVVSPTMDYLNNMGNINSISATFNNNYHAGSNVEIGDGVALDNMQSDSVYSSNQNNDGTGGINYTNYSYYNQYRNSNIDDENQADNNSDENVSKITSVQSEFGSSPKVVGQIFFSYIIVEYGDELLIVDFHAAYERLNYELIYKSISSQKIEYENLLVAFDIEYKDYEIDLIEDAKEYLESIGLHFERTGKTTLALYQIPIYLAKAKHNEAIIKNILETLIITDENVNKKSLEHFIKKSIERIACRYSPKANDQLSISELQRLIDTLISHNILLSCPHGRPFVIRMDKEYLDRKFFRI